MVITMEQFALELRRLIYTVICFQCLLQLVSGSVYQRYLKLFSYFLTMYMCCVAILSFAGQMEESLVSVQKVYDEWEKEWGELTDIQMIRESSLYYTDKIWNEKIIGDAYEQYDMKGEIDGADTEMDAK